ncbi:WbqC family protein [Roseateles toxinivorans]|uniref:WbqC-like protein n=1 Tax=Roseateles toxinivorans TaxID=270368 RepID=A0A4V3CTE3_9BURK|nr:WbqC family protein [Roseateles toxinivorans]TDP71387.1 WbqC-like protein [Roseateles toxinivorans]
MNATDRVEQDGSEDARRRVAVMQPYFLPYIGYFQLMSAVDLFVVFDDVNYINRGWINRNRMLVGGGAHLFSVPLSGASQNRLICDIELVADGHWRERLLRTAGQAYARAPMRGRVLPLLERVIQCPAQRLDEFLLHSLQEVAAYLAISTEIRPSSRVYDNTHLKAQDRIIDICKRERAGTYVNAIGGRELYDAAEFARQGLELCFVRPRLEAYAQQGVSEPVPGLSILDVLMNNDVPTVRAMLSQADLVHTP